MKRPAFQPRRTSRGFEPAAERSSRQVARFLLRTGTWAPLALGLFYVGCQLESYPLESSEEEGPIADQLVIEQGDYVVIGLGNSVQLRAVPKMNDGSEVSGYTISWSTSDPQTVSVEASGTVYAVKVGDAEVEATAKKTGKGKENAPGQLKKKLRVKVDPTQVASVEVVPSTAVLGVGGSVQLQAIVKDADGNLLANRVVSWSTSDGTVAEVNQSGSVSGLALGNVVITATSEGKSGTATLTVTEAAQTVDVAVWPHSVSLSPGQRAQYYAATLASDGSVGCTPQNPSLDADVLFNGNVVAGCDSARALLDMSKASTNVASR